MGPSLDKERLILPVIRERLWLVGLWTNRPLGKCDVRLSSGNGRLDGLPLLLSNYLHFCILSTPRRTLPGIVQ
jgi:hypothetical protein